MTDIDTDKLRALDEAATPGEWAPMKGSEEGDEDRCAVVAQRGKLAYLVATIENGAPGDFCDTEYANAELVAYLRNSVPAILAMAEDNKRLREALETIARNDPWPFEEDGSAKLVGPQWSSSQCGMIARKALGKDKA